MRLALLALTLLAAAASAVDPVPLGKEAYLTPPKEIADALKKDGRWQEGEGGKPVAVKGAER